MCMGHFFFFTKNGSIQKQKKRRNRFPPMGLCSLQAGGGMRTDQINASFPFFFFTKLGNVSVDGPIKLGEKQIPS